MLSYPWVACAGIALTFVGTLYVVASPSPRKGLGRDHPWIIKRRFCAVAFTCSVAWLPYYLYVVPMEAPRGEILAKFGVRLGGMVAACVYPLLLTALLFLGTLLQAFLDGDLRWPWANKTALQTFRVYVMAPVGEEWCFRACMLPLLMDSHIDPTTAILVCPLFFGAAHLHHGFELYLLQEYRLVDIALNIGVMFSYTTVFGWYAAFLFHRTGHLLAPVVAHIFCNHMGCPAFHEIPTHPYCRVLCVVYAVGIVGFAVLLNPATSAELFRY